MREEPATAAAHCFDLFMLRALLARAAVISPQLGWRSVRPRALASPLSRVARYGHFIERDHDSATEYKCVARAIFGPALAWGAREAFCIP
jgi:hypothetical protein